MADGSRVMGNVHRKKRKARQRGRRASEEAWDAFERGDLAQAEKLLRSALKGHEDDPVLWNDLGVILWRREELRDAEKAFRNALVLQPGYEEPKANLAALLGSRGFYRQALRIEEELATKGSVRDEYHQARTEEYRRAIEELDAEGPPKPEAP